MEWTGSPLGSGKPVGSSTSPSQSWTTHVAEAIWLAGSSGRESSSTTRNLSDLHDLSPRGSRDPDPAWQTVFAVLSLVAAQTLLVLVIAAWMGF